MHKKVAVYLMGPCIFCTILLYTLCYPVPYTLDIFQWPRPGHELSKVSLTNNVNVTFDCDSNTFFIASILFPH